MTQLNIHMTPDFEELLAKFMRVKGLRTKSEAVRLAVREGLERALRSAQSADFTAWLGLGKRLPEKSEPRFPSDTTLWE